MVPNQQSQTKLIFQNVSVNYLVTGTELLIGIFMLPFNVAHLGQSAYGLWVLVASITVYFSMFDLGYGVAQVRFAAKYRAQGDVKALNEIASTMFCVFSGIGLLTFLVAGVIALNLDNFFELTPAQVRTGQIVLLFISAYVALGFPVSVFGGIVNGFQRQYMDGAVAFVTAIVVALKRITPENHVYSQRDPVTELHRLRTVIEQCDHAPMLPTAVRQPVRPFARPDGQRFSAHIIAIQITQRSFGVG